MRQIRHLISLVPLLGGLWAHDAAPFTHSLDRGVAQRGPRLVVSVSEQATGAFLAARFSVTVDGKSHVPEWVDEHGIRFTSHHHSKKEFFTACYARGTGAVTVSLPRGAREVEVTAVRGFEYLPANVSARVENERASVQLNLHRWIDLPAEGWIAVDEHLHYDRLDASADPTWLTMLAADGLAAGHFMTLKGGMMAGVWARQFAYGREGRATDGSTLVVPGEEYRDPLMGHINLLGLDRLIEPISTGGLGTPITPENFPPFHDVLLAAREAGALTGVAHGGTLGRQSTAVADAVLGGLDFWEVSNGFIHSTETWYRLMNCGYFLPPVAGTDLPNSPFRDPWQPMLGSVRTYVHTEGRIDFESFKSAVVRGRMFITGGPIIDFSVNGEAPGGTVRLPAEGGRVVIQASLSSSQPIRELRLIHNGRELRPPVTSSVEGPIRRLVFAHELTFTESGWVAAAGRGDRSAAQKIDAMAHTGAVRVLVGDRPVRSKPDLTHFIELVARQRDYYLKEGRYRSEGDRRHVAALYERALEQLNDRLKLLNSREP